MYPLKVETLLARLNRDQQYVAAAGSGQFVVLGSPGAGKTTALEARIARMYYDGLDPKYILAMTFTNDAANTLVDRLTELGIAGVRTGTMHSVARSIVAEYSHLMNGLGVDESNKLEMEIKKLLGDWKREKKLTYKRGMISVRGIARFVEDAKACGPVYVAEDPFRLNHAAIYYIGNIARAHAPQCGMDVGKLMEFYCELDERRQSRGLLTYDDMMSWAWMLLVTDEMVRTSMRSKYSCVIIDEMQDCTKVQWDLAFFLTGLGSCISSGGISLPQKDDLPHNLMAAGQAEQAIFSWRSADLNILVDYCNRPDVHTIRLPLSYRNPPDICHVASTLVEHKTWNVLGRMVPTKAESQSIDIQAFDTPEEEARETVAYIRELTTNGLVKLRDSVVLSRLSVGLQLAEIECIRARIPYILRASGSFIQSPQVVDLLNYMRVACGADSDGKALKAIINRPFRMIGKQALVEAGMCAEQRGISLLDALLEMELGLHCEQRRALKDLYELLRHMNQIALRAENPPPPKQEQMGAEAPDGPYRDCPSKMLLEMLDTTKYLKMLQEEDGDRSPDESRQAIVTEILRIAAAFRSPLKFLGYMDALRVAVHQARAKGGLRIKKDAEQDALVLSTLHRCKGLQWDNVFIIDVVDGHFPHGKAELPDEELRLLYVAITRAAKHCTLSYSQPSLNGDGKKSNETSLSPFILLVRGALLGWRDKINK